MKTLNLLTFLLISISSFAQTWDGGGDQTSWDDQLNWDNDMVPATGDTIIIPNNTTLVLTSMNPVTNFPARIQVNNGSSVTFNLDLTIGNGNAPALKGQASTNIIISSGNTLNINAPSNKEGFQINASSGSTFTIQSGATVNILSARDGVEITSGNSLINNGTLNITGANRDGIIVQAGGTLTNTNTGSLTITQAGQDGIESSGVLTNNGTLIITEAGQNGIELAGSFENQTSGTVDVLRNSGGQQDEAAIRVLSGGAVTNEGVIDADGGTGTTNNSRSLTVESGGSFTNNATLNLSGGSASQNFFIDGTFLNNKLATTDLSTNRGRVNLGTLTNDGLMTSTRTNNTPIFFSGTGAGSDFITNNAFYDFNSFDFASSSADNGINLASTLSTVIDLNFACQVTIVNVPCEWSYDDGTTTQTLTPNGNNTLIFTPDFFDAPTATLQNFDYPDYGTIIITLNNICGLAVPVDLVKFEAAPKGRTVLLSWSTASEINHDFFQIEKATSKDAFTSIGQINGLGNSRSIKDYEFSDDSPSIGTNHYRLKQVDLDGQFTYSDIRVVEFESENKADIQVRPSVLRRGETMKVTINTTSDIPTDVFITDMSGKTSLLSRQASGEVAINTSDLSKGMYIVHYIAGGQTQSTKITIL